MKSIQRPILSAIRGGSYATQAAAPITKEGHHKFVASPQEGKVTRLPNGVVVASYENYSPLARVSVLYHAGSRHEPADQLGITHCIRAAANLSSQKTTAFMIAKQLQQIGGNLTCTTNREHVEYVVNCLRSDLSEATALLGQVATLPAFKPWEVSSLSRKLKLDLELYHRTPEARLMEALHKAAYRDTLGNSLYMNEESVGSFSPKALEAFVAANQTGPRAAVIGIGVDHDQLLIHARRMTFHQGGAPGAENKKAKYYGGEARIQVKSPLVYAALVTEGVALSAPEFLPMTLLSLALGIGPFVKYSANTATSKISKVAHSATTNPVAACCINLNYSDSGLFGCQVVASAKDIKKVLTAVVGTMGQATKGSISDADLQRAKNQMKSVLSMYHESSDAVLESYGRQAILAGRLFPAGDVVSAVDKITADDVNKLAKKVINGKPTLAVVGDLSYTPYLDELVAARA